MIKLLTRALNKAEQHWFYLWLVNRLLHRIIPFNRPHNITLTRLSNTTTTAKLPFTRKNKNHLGGMHACALATACEYVCGITLIRQLPPDQYRLILKNLSIDYEAQARGDVFVQFEASKNFTHKITEVLEEHGAVMETCTVYAHDKAGKLICAARVTWQLKSWKLVGKK